MKILVVFEILGKHFFFLAVFEQLFIESCLNDDLSCV